jgi:hypothetical protein
LQDHFELGQIGRDQEQVFDGRVDVLTFLAAASGDDAGDG